MPNGATPSSNGSWSSAPATNSAPREGEGIGKVYGDDGRSRLALD
jgi:hypothetical protein